MQITKRQLEIIKAIWETGNTKIAARRVGLAVQTLDFHTRKVRKKWGLEGGSLIDMLRRAVRGGLISCFLLLCLGVEAQNKRTVEVAWTAPTLPVNAYRVYQSVNGGKTNSVLTFSTTYDKSYAQGDTVFCYVTSVAGSLESRPSNIVGFRVGRSGKVIITP